MHAFRRLLSATAAAVAFASPAAVSASADPLMDLELDPGVLTIQINASATAVRIDVTAWARDIKTGKDPAVDRSLLLATFTSPGVLIQPRIELCTDHPDTGTTRYSCNREISLATPEEVVALVAEITNFGYTMNVAENSVHNAATRNGHTTTEPLFGFPAPGPGNPDIPGKYQSLQVTPQNGNVQAVATPPKFKPSIRVRNANGQELGGVRARFYTKNWTFLCEGVSNTTGQVNECVTPNPSPSGSGYAAITTGQSAALLLPLVGGYNAVIARECPTETFCYQNYVVSGNVQSI